MIKYGQAPLGRMTFGVAVGLGLVLSTPVYAGPGTYFGTIGGGISVVPNYEGSDDYETQALPVVSLGWKSDPVEPKGGTGVQLGLHDIELGFPTGLEAGLAKLYRPEGVYRMSLGLGYDFGRDEDDNDALTGLGDIDGHGLARLGLNFEAKESGWEYALTYQHAMSPKNYGSTIEGRLGYAFALSEQVTLTPSVQAIWADEDHMQSRFGVSQAQAANSGYARFTPEAGFKTNTLGLKLGWAISENWFMSGDLEVTELVGDAADSPMVDAKGRTSQVSSMLALVYMF